MSLYLTISLMYAKYARLLNVCTAFKERINNALSVQE